MESDPSNLNKGSTLDPAIPRFDQPPANFSDIGSTIGHSTMGDEYKTHATSTVDHKESVYSYESVRDAAKFLKDEAGRTFNAQNDTYFMPTVGSFLF